VGKVNTSPTRIALSSKLTTDGRIFQVEYAVKAVENGGTAIGIKFQDGVVLAIEKIITSKLLKPGANKRIQTIDRHVGVVSKLRLHLVKAVFI
jgi:20S proteasome subunit alpha 7